MGLSESDTRAKLIDPALHARGWTEDLIRREETAGAIEIINGKPFKQTKGRIDYTLRLKVAPEAQPVAVALIEAKPEERPPDHGLEQAKLYGASKRLNVQFVFASNGHQFVEYDRFTGLTHAPRLLAEFPTPAGDLNGHVEEMFTGHNVVKVFGRQKAAIEVFDEQNEGLYEASFKAQFVSGMIQPVMNFVGNLNYVAVAVVGGLMVANGRISLGDVQAFIQYSRQFTMPITQTASIMNVLQSTAASAERVFELLDETEEEPEAAEVVTLPHTRGHITLRDVSFRYVPDTPLIEHLDLDVPPGQTVAIVGPTGAGKTTLVNLLLRFYELDGGAVLIDGVDSRQMSRSDLRRLFGMVLQDTWLFTGTIRENIAYGREGAGAEEILAAARAARVDHFVRTLPNGYDTVLDDDATNVSQGEKQLLTIARAFLADPDVLILDEATSSVDTRTEVLIQGAMAELMEGRTSFVIAHRLSTIHGADTILVMDRGRIVEQGTHEELLARRGFYHDLYASQFTEALVEAS